MSDSLQVPPRLAPAASGEAADVESANHDREYGTLRSTTSSPLAAAAAAAPPPPPPPPPEPAANAAAAASPNKKPSGGAPTPRALAPDLLRGLLMVLMALDHSVAALKPWGHGQSRGSETDAEPVPAWNQRDLGYAIRTLTHLCAPGFALLLGMGVVYFSRSRSQRLGWGAARLARHYALRAAVLTAITVGLGVVFTAGRYWFLNAVLFALAVDYLLVGLLWLLFARTEPALAAVAARFLPRDLVEEDAARPLIVGQDSIADKREGRARALAWHVHNAVLAVLTGVTIWWNIWLSPTHGHCLAEQQEMTVSSTTQTSAFWRIWFYIVVEGRVISVFPPLAWLSFAILGLLYGRLILARPWPAATVRLATLAAAFAFGLLFVFTRVFQFGNLSQGCLRTPDQAAHPGGNQYLASPKSFFFLVKYPPDVAFFAFTLAANFLLLAVFDFIPHRIAARLTVLTGFGGSALFFYIVHHPIVFSAAAVLTHWFGRPLGEQDPLTGKPAFGVDNVWILFGLWAGTLTVLFPICQWYSRFKMRKSADSIWRFF
ncbi:hypothetical protein F4780DRAFT_719853 [Xylariomycetidae sp. FL0641]|nr:hypothetical protein F4780DRAFT_719853 [Xylariomycetidae sp. FL0641]